MKKTTMQMATDFFDATWNDNRSDSQKAKALQELDDEQKAYFKNNPKKTERAKDTSVGNTKFNWKYKKNKKIYEQSVQTVPATYDEIDILLNEESAEVDIKPEVKTVKVFFNDENKQTTIQNHIKSEDVDVHKKLKTYRDKKYE